MATGLELAKIRISDRCDGYHIRWYYNGWHYWLFESGDVQVLTEGENYRTIGTMRLAMGSRQITQQEVNAIRTLANTREIYILTDFGWRTIRIESGSWRVQNNITYGYDLEFIAIVGARLISDTGFSPRELIVPSIPNYQYEETACIGSQIWMSKNYDSNYPGSKVYNDSEDNRAIYGGLYTWAQANASGFAPPGWHLPSIAEWLTLINQLGGLAVAGGELKEVGTSHWAAPNTGAVDSVGFTQRPTGGFLEAFGYYSIYSDAILWASDGFVFLKYNTATIGYYYITGGSYYYGVRLIKDEVCEAIPVSLLVTSRGTGTAVAAMKVQAFANTTATLDGNAHFYTDAAGTLGESQTWNITAGSLQTIYVKCTSGTANLTFANGRQIQYLGYATGLGSGTVFWYKGSGADADVPSVTMDNVTKDYFPNLEAVFAGITLLDIYNIATNDLPESLISFAHLGTGTVSGDIADIPDSVVNFGAWIGCTLSGNIANLPAGLLRFLAYGTNTITGDVANLPTGVTNFLVTGSNTISGDIGDIPNTMLQLQIYGSNTVSGDVVDITANMTSIAVSGSNTITGDVADLPATLTYIYITGNNTMDGNVDDMPPNTAYFHIDGNNTITGGFAGITGTLSNGFIVGGNNTINGDLSDLPATCTYFQISGNNTITGNISDIAANMAIFSVTGSNTIDGDIGDLNDSTCYYFYITGNNTIADYTGRTWNATQNNLVIIPVGAGGLSAAEVDQLLIDIDADCAFTGTYKIVNLTGTNAAPTAASAAARASLIGKGVTLTTN